MNKPQHKIRGFSFLSETYDTDKIPKKTKWIFSVASIFRDSSYQLISSFLLTFMMYSGVLATGNASGQYTQQIFVINIIFIVCLIWDALNDPIMGVLIEKVHFKTGKYKPWILIGGIGNTIVLLCLFLLRPTGWTYIVCFGIFYFLWDFVFTMNDCAYWAMLPSLTSDEKERNNVTTMVSIFVSLGTFAMYGVCSILPTAKNSSYIYGYIAIPTAILFLLSQLAIYFLCKEKKIDETQSKVSEQVKLADMFKMLDKNKPLLIIVLSLLFYYTASSLVVSFGSNYFYLSYGYGGETGGSIMLIFTVMYALGTLLSQFLFKPLIDKFKRQTLLTWTFFIAIAAYIMLFLVGFPIFGDKPLAYNPNAGGGLGWAFRGTLSLLYIPPLLFFGAEGIYYMVLIVMLQNTIEYGEYKYNERKEAVVSSWRPFTAKLSSAIQKGIILVTFLSAGIYGVTQQISETQSELASKTAANSDKADLYANEAATKVTSIINEVARQPKIIMGIWMIGATIILLAASYILVHFFYEIDEEKYDLMVKEIKKRKDTTAQ